MKKLIIVMVVVLLVGSAGTVYFFHIVRSEKGMFLVKKQEPGLADSYLDTRTWGILDHARYPYISARLIKKSVDDVTIRFSRAADNLQRQYDSIIDEFKHTVEQRNTMQKEIKAIRTEFEKRWKSLKTEYENCTSEETLDRLEKKKQTLFDWFRNEVESLKATID